MKTIYVVDGARTPFLKARSGPGPFAASDLATQAGRSLLGPGAMGCAAPDQPNIDTLLHLASPGQREGWLAPLLRGEIRSTFAMTEPAPGVGSDPRMISTRSSLVAPHRRLTRPTSGAWLPCVSVAATRFPAGR